MTPRPAQLLISDAVNAADRFMGILAPRRSTKTSALFAVAMGRISLREDYSISYTMATTALKARARFKKDIAEPLEFLFPDTSSRPFKLNYGGGSESVRWLETGSLLQFGAPKGDNYRSDAWDLIIVDEAGEAEPEMTDDLISGALATMDTIPDALFIAAGTAGDIRAGNLLYQTLDDGREGRNRTTVIEFAAPPTTTLENVMTSGEKDWDKTVPLLVAAHPGIDHGTTLADLRTNFDKMKPQQFLKEYLGIFGQIGSMSFLDQIKFGKGLQASPLPAPPELFTLAFSVHLNSTVASIVAAWRDDDGRACWLVMYNGPVRGLHREVLRLALKYRANVAYDSGNGATDSEAQKLMKARPRPRMVARKWSDVSTAASLTVKEIESENVVHWGQDALDGAVRLATKRGARDSKRWSFGRPDEDDDITALEAAAIALHTFDDAPPRAALTPSVAS
ncbi:hypothetical protein QMG83_14490 [Salinibacterium sp. G-O1]|uniref:hypothetical protein n=1 Tax=Salinibacterium sp. G-O1 TaxID=3046208 RepID=UPI0024B9E466|nr:hypothetical protein [Salinibacterium sp. G-O1]MDJ0336432.1 hypothetical protein [Salinibacterium sp. G-O1]